MALEVFTGKEEAINRMSSFLSSFSDLTKLDFEYWRILSAIQKLGNRPLLLLDSMALGKSIFLKKYENLR